MLGVCQQQTYEGQAGTELEACARRCPHDAHGWETPDDLPGLIAALVAGLRGGVDVPCLAAAFHRGLAGLFAAALREAAAGCGAELIGLSGGVAQNTLFCEHLRAGLGTGQLVEHSLVPANDGGLSLGQALAGMLHRSL